ncbi:MAG: hypothetical protein J6Y67_00965 [Lachnospiraceae bacterium]|nr:hypothetical protein [Lachnospiraceae bacterium]
MAKYVMDYETGEYEFIEEYGFSIDRGEYTYNWDNSEYRREEEEGSSRFFRWNNNEEDEW